MQFLFFFFNFNCGRFILRAVKDINFRVRGVLSQSSGYKGFLIVMERTDRSLYSSSPPHYHDSIIQPFLILKTTSAANRECMATLSDIRAIPSVTWLDFFIGVHPDNLKPLNRSPCLSLLSGIHLPLCCLSHLPKVPVWWCRSFFTPIKVP